MGVESWGRSLTMPGEDGRSPRQDGDRAWYLYGIALGDRSLPDEPSVFRGLDDREPVQAIRYGNLTAMVSIVSLSEFSADAMRERVQDAVWLEAMVRGHERVVEAIHRGNTILPSRFGCVYATQGDIVAALARDWKALLDQLEKVRGCDEWGIRVYAHRPTIGRRVATEDPAINQLQQSLASVPPGRAYFLQRRLDGLLSSAIDQAIGDLAQEAFDELVGRAVAGQIGPRTSARPTADGEVEILRAAFLVRRNAESALVTKVRSIGDSHAGLRCEYSGPWPPYSFVAPVGEDRE